jgi:hypothetical protein
MQFYRKCKILYRKAVAPISIIFIPLGNARRTINLNISTAGIGLITFFFFANLIFLCYMIPSLISYHNMKRQFLDYSQKVSNLNATLLALNKANKYLHTLIPPGAKEGKYYQEKRFIFNVKATDMIKYNQIIANASEKYNVEAALIKAIIKMESNFDHLAVSPNGAQGLMQLMPQTAQALQIEDSFHPENNIEGGTRYLRYLLDLFEENLPLALAAYNVGENIVIKYNNKIPPYRETQEFVQRVLDHLYSYRRIDQRIKNRKVISYNGLLSRQQETTVTMMSDTIANE